MDTNFYKFTLSFKGQLVENSVDAFDVANTILATSQALYEIANIHYGKEIDQVLKININAFKQGSLTADFVTFMETTSGALIPLLPEINQGLAVGKQLIKTYKTFIDVRKFLSGKAPKKITPLANNTVNVYGNNNNVYNITINELRALQDKNVIKSAAKAVEPLVKPDSLLESISIIEESNQGEKIEPILVQKDEAPYLKSEQEFQTLEDVKYKGIISKIDTKARSGYLTLSQKRLPFTYPITLTQNKFEIMTESLRRKVQIYLVGDVVMDYESNPRNMLVNDVEEDLKLFK